MSPCPAPPAVPAEVALSHVGHWQLAASGQGGLPQGQAPWVTASFRRTQEASLWAGGNGSLSPVWDTRGCGPRSHSRSPRRLWLAVFHPVPTVTDVSCVVTDFCTVTYMSCAVTYMSYVVTDLSCTVTYMSCEVTYVSCTVTDLSCAVTYMSCTVTDMSCAVTDLSCTAANLSCSH